MSKPTVAEALDKLAALGSARQIAQFFESEGITGVYRNTFQRPVANYVSREVGMAVSVDGDHISTAYEYVKMYDDHRAIARFIDLFDSDCYPELYS